MDPRCQKNVQNQWSVGVWWTVWGIKMNKFAWDPCEHKILARLQPIWFEVTLRSLNFFAWHSNSWKWLRTGFFNSQCSQIFSGFHSPSPRCLSGRNSLFLFELLLSLHFVFHLLFDFHHGVNCILSFSWHCGGRCLITLGLCHEGKLLLFFKLDIRGRARSACRAQEESSGTKRPLSKRIAASTSSHLAILIKPVHIFLWDTELELPVLQMCTSSTVTQKPWFDRDATTVPLLTPKLKFLK